MNTKLPQALHSLTIVKDRLVLATEEDPEEDEDENQLLALAALLMLLYGISEVNARKQAVSWLQRFSAAQIRRRLYSGVMRGIIHRGTSLISVLSPEDRVQLVHDILQLGKGGRTISRTALQRLLQRSYSLPEGDAKRIAVDQARKYRASSVQAQMMAAGDVEYVWITKLDERVRATHRLNHGKTFNWLEDAPNGTIRPGYEHNCRCVPQAVRR